MHAIMNKQATDKDVTYYHFIHMGVHTDVEVLNFHTKTIFGVSE